MLAVLAKVNNVKLDDIVTVAGLVIVIGCLIGAGFAAFRQLWIAVGLLVLVAIIAAFLLLS